MERGNIDLDTDIREYLPEGFLTKPLLHDGCVVMKVTLHPERVPRDVMYLDYQGHYLPW